MLQITIIAVGRLREPHWKMAVDFYAKRLQRGYNLVETVIRDADASLSPQDRAHIESERILQQIKGNVMPVCLDERGESMPSVRFAEFLLHCFDSARFPCFIIGGAYGLSQTIRDRAVKLMSFGPMTLPHELARVLLFEQLYRADSIMHGRPYHHG